MASVCSSCGKEYFVGAKFCSECGNKIDEQTIATSAVFACSGCGKEYPVGTNFCSMCGNKVEEKSALTVKPLPERYDIFISYSHADANLYGQETIDKIKQEIQAELQDIACRPLVFLDTEALQYGDEWHAKIMERMRECKIFVCLLSENYFKSPYCTRERLWWAHQELWSGRLRKDTLPVYYVKLEPDPWQNPSHQVKDLFGFQLEQQNATLVSWFSGKEKVKEEFIRERLDSLKNDVKEKLKKHATAAESFCSVTPGLSLNFVGRILELKELREICANGHYPIIQAAGGVGKTELSVAYAFGYAEDYPQGRFLIHMEGKRNWRDALLSMLNDSRTGRRTREELNISDEDIKKTEEEQFVTLMRKLFERAEKGRLLLLLDNVDDSSIFKTKKLREISPEGKPIPANLHMVATTRHHLDYPKRCKAQAMTVGNLQMDEAFELFCSIGENQFPFCKKADVGDDVEAAALREIITLLDGHVWSMEIIAGYMAENYSNGMTFQKKLENLKKDFVVEGENSYRNTDNSATLLKPTFEIIRELPLGEAIIDLLRFAALMNPDSIYTDVLENCWNKYFSHLEYKDGVPFTYALNTLRKYHLLNGDDRKKIHRLTHGAVRALMGDALPDYATKLALVLEETITFSQQDWCRVIRTTPELYTACSEEFKEYKFASKNWVRLLADNPAIEKICPWERLSGENWVSLLGGDSFFDLEAQPQFADKCPWEKLDVHDIYQDHLWVTLLSKQPQFAEKCPWNKLNEKLTNDDWGKLLKDQPQFADKCPWEKLDGGNWQKLLEVQPQFADKCPWEKLDGGNWQKLLSRQPQFADKCPWEKLSDDDWGCLLSRQPQFADKCPWEKLDGRSLADILREQPQFADKCPWEKLDGRNWAYLLRKQPQFADKCPWENVKEECSGWDWADLLSSQPQFADKCPWENVKEVLSGGNWASFLSSQPQFADKCPWNELDGWDWVDLLEKQPQFAEKIPWKKLSGKDLANLLSKQPQLANKCPWEKLSGGNWAYLLREQPQLAEKCPWEKMKAEGSCLDWAMLLCKQLQFAEKCPWEKFTSLAWEKFTSLAWKILLSKHPQFVDRCPLEKLRGFDWIDLLCRQPQFANKCPWEKLTGYDWMSLLRHQPQFADKCSWDKLNRELNSSEWDDFLSDQPQFADKCLDYNVLHRLLCHRPQFADKCPWNELDGKDLINLLRVYPQFAEKCPWEKLRNKLAGEYWVYLLREQPQFSEKCPWEKLKDELTNDDWVYLLCAQPQFADQCPWDKFTGEDWAYLLREQPQFADQYQCPWKIFSGWDWAYLLRGQPQFAEKCPWNELDGEDWVYFLREQPQFSDKCPWEKLDGWDWARLLSCQPQFADKCSWEKLDGEDWARLLGGDIDLVAQPQPQFADKCPWEKLDGWDWARLLSCQPQFADKCSWEKLSDDDWEDLLEEQPHLAKFRKTEIDEK